MSSPPNLAEMLGKIQDGICVLAPDRRLAFANDKAAQLLETQDAGFQAKIESAFADEAGKRFEYFHSAINRWFEHQVHRNADGGLTIVSRDITSRHRMEEALRSNEERFRRVIDSNIIGVIVVEAGVITEANDVFLKMIGYSRKDLVTHSLRWRQMTPAEYDPQDAKARHELQQDGVFPPYEREFFRKDGNRVPILISGVTIQGPPNTPETLCLVMDLSERRRAEERIRSIVECSKILASSLECEKTFPELAEFIVSKLADACMILVQEDDGVLVRLAAAARAPAPPRELEWDIRTVLQTGKPRVIVSPVSSALIPMMARGKPLGVLAVTAARPEAFADEDIHLFEELSRRAVLALESARMYHETQRANRLKDEFVAIVSHELRTPLTPILGGVYMLRSDPHDESVVSRALDIIERNAKTQVKIVDDLLDVSRALSGKLRLNLENVDLSAIISAAVETIRPATEAKGIQIGLKMAVLHGVVAGDADRLQQVFWNLLANAVKFTPNDGRIVVELAEAGGHAEVRVIDTGIGINADFIPHVFERFRQADSSRTRPHGGLGLGLAIVRHLVESHGGTVHALSAGDDEGATFVVRLPLRSISALGKTSPS
jgi:PAS domain S-box-containing protein